MSDRTPAPNRPPRSPRYWLTWLALSATIVAAWLPWSVQRRLGGAVGFVAYHLARSRRKAAHINIEYCFPELTPFEKNKLLRESFTAFGIGIFEFIRAWWGKAEPMRATVEIEGLDHLQTLREAGRGVLLVSGHFMTLEMCGRLLCEHIELAGMYRRYRNPVTDWAVTRGRLRYACAMFTNTEIRAAVRHLKRGGFLWYAPDQDMRGKDTIFAPFFGRPAATITATHQLARMTRCAVVPFFHRRENDRYILRIAAPLKHFPSDDILADTTRVNAVIEDMVREAPPQYLWIHRRFKRQPGGRNPDYG